MFSRVDTDVYNKVKKVYGNKDVTNEQYVDIVKQLKEYFHSKLHVLAARYTFLQTKMKPNETYAEWVAHLRGAARECQLTCPGAKCAETYTDWAIRDIIVLHTPHDVVRTACLQKKNPTLDEVLSIAQTRESTQSTIKLIKNE